MEAAFAPQSQLIARELGTDIVPTLLGGVPVLRLLPRGHKPTRQRVLYIHGGSYAFLSSASTVGVPALIADATGLEVISIDYSRAPRARWETVTEEVVSVWRALTATGLDPAALGIVGESSGGGLAASATLKMRDDRLELPGALWLLSPWSDISGVGDSRYTLKDGDP